MNNIEQAIQRIDKVASDLATTPNSHVATLADALRDVALVLRELSAPIPVRLAPEESSEMRAMKQNVLLAEENERLRKLLRRVVRFEEANEPSSLVVRDDQYKLLNAMREALKK